MKARWIALGTTLGFVVALTLGFVLDEGSSPPDRPDASMDATDMMSAITQMHDSEAMRGMHSQMPAELRAQCDALHEQMSGMMGDGTPGGMMGDGTPGGMMGSGTPGGMMGSGGHASHHPGGMDG